MHSTVPFTTSVAEIVSQFVVITLTNLDIGTLNKKIQWYIFILTHISLPIFFFQNLRRSNIYIISFHSDFLHQNWVILGSIFLSQDYITSLLQQQTLLMKIQSDDEEFTTMIWEEDGALHWSITGSRIIGSPMFSYRRRCFCHFPAVRSSSWQLED